MALARPGLWLPLLLLLQACASTPMGQQLADSFDTPVPSAEPSPRLAGQSPSAPKGAASTTAASDAAALQPTVTTSAKEQGADRQQRSKPVAAPRPAATPQVAQPYRITIRLSAADPSAPAEIVTRSLREAGIGFEVETIERIQPPATLRVSPEPRGSNP